jgi:hypothetical protein
MDGKESTHLTLIAIILGHGRHGHYGHLLVLAGASDCSCTESKFGVASREGFG